MDIATSLPSPALLRPAATAAAHSDCRGFPSPPAQAVDAAMCSPRATSPYLLLPKGREQRLFGDHAARLSPAAAVIMHKLPLVSEGGSVGATRMGKQQVYCPGCPAFWSISPKLDHFSTSREPSLCPRKPGLDMRHATCPPPHPTPPTLLSPAGGRRARWTQLWEDHRETQRSGPEMSFDDVRVSLFLQPITLPERETCAALGAGAQCRQPV